MITLPPFALEICVVIVGIFLLLVDALCKIDRMSIGSAAVVGLLAVFGATFLLGPTPPGLVPDGFYVADRVAIFFKQFMLLSTIITIMLAMDYAEVYQRYVPAGTPQAGLGEFFILPVFACAGLMWMVSSADFIMIFASLELVTICFYVLVASMRRNTGSLEAGVKYLILGALSTGFLVYGITWIYGQTGMTNLLQMPAALAAIPQGAQLGVSFGLGLVLVALGFKIAAAPFQFWVPDVYQGAPTPVTAFLSVASKAAGFIVLMRVVQTFLTVPGIEPRLLTVLTVLAALTLIYGNLAALPQTNLKRLLAYSSIAHAGYLLVGMASVQSPNAGPAIGFYLAGYLAMTSLAFLVLIHVSLATGGDNISDFNGLGRRSPLLAFGMMLAMLSLAGLPFTMGFLGKFLIFEAAMSSGQYFLVVIGAITVACGFYYYLRVVRAMYWQPAPELAGPIPVPPTTRLLLSLLCLAIVAFGIFPQPLLALLR